jgi:hypothetical protein
VDGLTSLRVGGNPLVCNCSVHWLWNVLRAEERRNGSRLELDSQEIVCADEEFAGKVLMSLPEGSLRCRLSTLYLSLSALGCLTATAAILGLVAHLTRARRRKRVPAYAAPTRPELLVYVGRAGDELPGKHQESYSRRLIARTEDLVYEAANQGTYRANLAPAPLVLLWPSKTPLGFHCLEYQQTRRKSGSESPESRETNVYETPRYSRPGRREAEQSFGTFYHQQRVPSPPGHYPLAAETRSAQAQEGVYAVADVTSLRHEQPDPELVSLYRMRNPGHLHRPEEPVSRDYGYEYEYDYEAPLPPQKPHVVFV